MSLKSDATTQQPFTLRQGDCLELLKELPANSVDAIVADPPAGIAFMGKDWDKDKGGREAWKAWMKQVAEECLRVIKPGGHALVWALPRTSHWTGDAWEDAGWDVREKVYHAFGSGFPKSLDIGKAIDKSAGAEREVVGVNKKPFTATGRNNGRSLNKGLSEDIDENGYLIEPLTAPATPEAQQWDGWGTALKPAVEEWWLFRKPFRGTVAGNVLEWGTGGVNVDGCRVGKQPGDESGANYARHPKPDAPGRFPAHLTHDGSEEVLGCFPLRKVAPSGKPSAGLRAASGWGGYNSGVHYEDDNGGSAARFFQSCPLDREDIEARRLFYCAKASKRDRDEGLSEETRNIHPTVKATPLMRWLCRLITPPGGLVLDPFAGSGSTGKGALLEGFRFIGFDLYQEHIDIAAARCRFALEQAQAEAERAEQERCNQLELFEDAK
jgi:DNA modification methylase